jgi:hypothetical protein
MSKPKKLIKSCELSSLDGVRELSFGKSSPEARMSGNYAKKPTNPTPRSYADTDARDKRYGLVKL